MTDWRSFLVRHRMGRPWIPGHARFLVRQAGGRRHADATSRIDHLRGAAGWLAAAQDSQDDGGFSGRYKLSSGWSSSYPETTGYIIPTLLALANAWNEPAWRERAARAIDFLLGVQLETGAFPGGEVAENRTAPSPFNTAQILNGLVAWHGATGAARVAEAAQRAAHWLIGVQDGDGAFRRHFYNGVASTYSAHLSCWLAEYGDRMDDRTALEAAARHLDWVLAHHDASTGWFDLAGFDEAQHRARIGFTHTIAYTIAGVLTLGLILGRDDAVEAARRAARGLAGVLAEQGILPGMVDHRWRPVEAAQCLTGNCQMALIWQTLATRAGERELRSAAVRALGLVMRTQDLDNPNPGLRGGIAGSDPVWGSYITMALPNWAVKFFIDAMLQQESLGWE